MKSFQVKDIEMTQKKPSLNSVIAQKRRLALAEQVRQGHEVERYTETEEKIMKEAARMSLVDHLGELRHRIIASFMAIIVCSCIAYYFVDDILQLLVAPAGTLYYTRPTEAFFTYMKVAMVSGIIISSPLWFYHIWAFILPALSKREKNLLMMVVPTAIILFLTGIVFAYYLVLPTAIQFLIGFGTDDLQPLLSVGQYIDFVIAFILPFGITFELPLLLIALGIVGVISSKMLQGYRKIFILVAFIIGAAISPTPDMISQTMIAAPMVVLYEVSYRILKHVLHR